MDIPVASETMSDLADDRRKKRGKRKGVVAYYGSCPSEQFVIHAFPDSNLGFFCFGINVASFIDDDKIELGGIEKWPEAIRKKLRFEAQRGFRERLRKAAPQTLVIDFARSTRVSIMRYGDSFLTVPYELLDAGPRLQAEAASLFNILPFGGPEYWKIVIGAMQEFCSFVSQELPDTEVILLDIPPTADYRGALIDSNTYMMDFCRWQLRYPISRTLIDFCLQRIENSRVLMPPVPLYCDDEAAYGPTPMHYSPKVWRQTAAIFRASGGFGALPRSSDPATMLANYSGIMGAFARTASTAPNLHRFGLDILHGALPYLFAKIQNPAGSYLREPIDAQDVVAAFRWILGREPESALTFLNHYALADRRELRNTLLRSSEFQNQVKHHAQY